MKNYFSTPNPMKKLLAIVLFFCGNYVLGQDTIFFDSNWGALNDKSKASYYWIFQYLGNDTDSAVAKMYYSSGQIKTERHYSSWAKKIQQGPELEWDDEGHKISEANYNEGLLVGEKIIYNTDGTVRKPSASDGKWTIENGETVFTVVEHMPEFKGGEKKLFKYLKKKIKYPKEAREKGITGRVYVMFVIDKTGAVKDARVIRGVSPELDEVALNAVKEMPKWKPGTQNGKFVNVQFNLPINFSLK